MSDNTCKSQVAQVAAELAPRIKALLAPLSTEGLSQVNALLNRAGTATLAELKRLGILSPTGKTTELGCSVIVLLADDAQ